MSETGKIKRKFLKKLRTFLKIMSENQKKSSNYKFKCDRCDKKFSYSSHLKIHVDSVHLGVKLKCEFCNYQSTTKGNLKSHINTVHFKLKPFQCDECDQSFGRSGDLKRHVDSVHKKIRFHCSFDDCVKSFTFKTNLSEHLKLHEGQVFCDCLNILLL